MQNAAENEEWRQKYFESLRTLEREERQFRAQEEQLRKLVNRLCLAAQGQSPRLDGELKKLRDALRAESTPDALEPLVLALTAAVHELDHGTATLTALKIEPPARVEPPAEAIMGDAGVRAVLSRILAELRREARLVPAIDALDRELAVSFTREQLPGVIERVGGLVVQRIQSLEKSQQELELLVGQMLVQLEALNRYVAGQDQDEIERSASNATLGEHIAGEVQAMGESAERGSDLADVRRQLRLRMDSISRHLQDFRERETERARQARERTEQMRSRMDEMEQEARGLHARLLDEKRLSLLDPLTQIPNRLAYEQRASEELERWKRFGLPTCIAIWDIDGFKAINDNYGHRAGDKVLTVVAECLAQSIRSTDFVARFGGEEFVMLLPGTSVDAALKLVNDMREAVGQLGFHFRGTPVSITISCGLTALREGDRAEDAFERADKAMYQAKEAGRNRVASA